MTDWPTVTPGNAWAAEQGRFLGVYRAHRSELPSRSMWMRAWVESPPPARVGWGALFTTMGLLRRLIGLSETRSAVALYEEGAAAGTAPALVVSTSQEEDLDLDDMIAVTVVGTIAENGHFVIDAGGYGDLTPSSNPRSPLPGAPTA
ncbi:MAG: hypothetical protein AAF480_08430 [Actinomycetota bacterium]